jgi:hypothetical protein
VEVDMNMDKDMNEDMDKNVETWKCEDMETWSHGNI